MNNPTFIRRLALLAFFTLIVSAGCNEEYSNFGEQLDTTKPIDPSTSNTWMMTTESASFFLTLETLEETEDAGFILWHLALDSSGTIFSGRYTLRGEDLTLRADTQFDVPNEAGIPAARRVGTVRTQHDSPIIFEASLTKIGRTLTIREADGEERDWYHIGDIYTQLDLDDPKDQETFLRFYILTEVIGTSRVPAWGGSGMFQYIGKPFDFLGLLNGHFTLDMTGLLNVVTKVIFNNKYADLGGISIGGIQSTTSDTSGNGKVSGTTNFVMDPRLDDVSPIKGAVTYDLTVKEADLAGGTYSIELANGDMFSVPYTASIIMDFRDVVQPQ